MENIKDETPQTQNKLHIGYVYGLLHLLVEILCFHMLGINNFTTGVISIISVALFFDFFAFVPQFIFGHLFDRFTKIRLDYIAVLFFVISLLLFGTTDLKVIPLLLLCLGNAILHEAGAVVTTSVSDGKLSHSAIFVAGGSFGVIIGQTLGKQGIPIFYEIITIILIFIIVYATQQELYEKRKISNFDLVKPEFNIWHIVILAFSIVTIRAFLGYAIPITWKKEIWQAFALFFTMGFGKALGGILSDKFGAKTIGVGATLLCIPFLIVGKDIMLISIIGVFLFSCTMAITFGMLLSVLKNQPGVAFGITTIGLFIGVFPVLLFGIPRETTNIVLIIVLSLFSAYALNKTLK